ncbi:MAG: GNAT family N-acetyltransferase [Methanobacteriota archaeon]
MKIRKASRNDAQAIAVQNVLLAQESENISLEHDTVLKGVQAILADPKKGFYVIAEEKNMIIGQLMITFEWSDWKNAPIWWIQSVYVQKNWRKKGVFTQLLQYVQQKAREKHVAMFRLYVHKNNNAAQKVYQQFGLEKQPYVFYQLKNNKKKEKTL